MKLADTPRAPTVVFGGFPAPRSSTPPSWRPCCYQILTGLEKRGMSRGVRGASCEDQATTRGWKIFQWKCAGAGLGSGCTGALPLYVPCGAPSEKRIVDRHQGEGEGEDYDARVEDLNTAGRDRKIHVSVGKGGRGGGWRTMRTGSLP